MVLTIQFSSEENRMPTDFETTYDF